MNFVIMKLEHKVQIKLLTPLFDKYGKVLTTETKCSLQFGPEWSIVVLPIHIAEPTLFEVKLVV